MRTFQPLIADVEDQLGAALLAGKNAATPGVDRAPLGSRNRGRTASDGSGLGLRVLLLRTEIHRDFRTACLGATAERRPLSRALSGRSWTSELNKRNTYGEEHG
jgi:hypothetical protein